MADRFVMSSRQAAELDHAFERNGWTAADVKRLSSGDVLARLLPHVRAYPLPNPPFAYDLTKRYLTLLEDVNDPQDFTIDLDLVPFLRGGENHISGLEMRARAKELGANLGQRYAEYLQARRQELPEKFRDKILVFPGTLWEDFGLCGHQVVCLQWHEGDWHLGTYPLKDVWGNDWNAKRSLVRPRANATSTLT